MCSSLHKESLYFSKIRVAFAVASHARAKLGTCTIFQKGCKLLNQETLQTSWQVSRAFHRRLLHLRCQEELLSSINDPVNWMRDARAIRPLVAVFVNWASES